MPTNRALQGVVNSFLTAFVSRYSHYNGYWLLGFLVDEPVMPEFDLLSVDRTALSDVIAAANRRAADLFADQLLKGGLALSDVVAGQLTLKRLSRVRELREGYLILAGVTATHRCGRCYSASQKVFAAPHDPRLETQSGPVEAD